MGAVRHVIERIQRYEAFEVDLQSIHSLSTRLSADRYEVSHLSGKVTFFTTPAISARVGDFLVFKGRTFVEVCTYSEYVEKYEEVK